MGDVVVLLVLLTVVLGGVGLYRRHAVNQRKAEEQAALETQLSTSKRAADEDVTKFGAKTPMKRPAQPEEIAPAYVFLASPQCSSYITGEILPIIGGY